MKKVEEKNKFIERLKCIWTFIRKKWWNTILLLIIAFTAIMAYYSLKYYWVQFHEYPFSDNPIDWGVFGDYIGGTLNPLLSIISVVVTIWLTIVINNFANHNADRQIDAERRIARLQLRNEALKEFRIELNEVFVDLKRAITLENVDKCYKTLNNFAVNYTYLFDFIEIKSHGNLMSILSFIKAQIETGSSSISLIQYALQAEMGRQELLSDLGEAVLE